VEDEVTAKAFGGNLKVGARLGIAFGVLVALALLIAFVGVGRLDALNRDFTRIVVDRHARTNLLHAIIDEANVMSRSVHGAFLREGGGHASEIGRMDAAKRNVSDMLERLDKMSLDEDRGGRDLLQQVHDRTAVYLVSLLRFTRLLAADRRDEAKTLLGEKLGAEMDSAFEAMRLLSKHHTDVMQVRQAEAATSYERARNLTAALALIAGVLAVLVAVWIARGITRPLRQAVSVAGLVASGDLTSTIQVQGNDETGQLMAALSRMNQSLTKIVSEVRMSSDAIVVATKQLVGGNRDLQHRTEKQTSSLQDAASTMDEFTATVAQNASNAKQANELARGASVVAGQGGEVVSRVVEKMASISASSKRIVDIIAVIDGIAFQTNILALNAAVEAARAGDQGRGFAVVAQEVRALAQRSATAAKEIKQLIADSVSNVRDGAKLVDQARRTMDDIVGNIGKVTQIVGEISQQGSAIERVNRVLAEMDRVTQQNAALAEQTSAAVESLEQQASYLAEAVSVFKLGDGEPQPHTEPLDPEYPAANPLAAASALLPLSGPPRVQSRRLRS
jgi:methyl-accepting chemotaxis protein